MKLIKKEIVEITNDAYDYKETIELGTVQALKVTAKAVEEVEILINKNTLNRWSVESSYNLQDYQEDCEDGDEFFFLKRKDPYENMGFEQVTPVKLENYLKLGFKVVEEDKVESTSLSEKDEEVEKSTLKVKPYYKPIIKEAYEGLSLTEECRLELALEDENKCIGKVNELVDAYAGENLQLIEEVELETEKALYGVRALEVKEPPAERKRKSPDRTTFRISKEWFWTLKLDKVFDMAKCMQMQEIENYEHPYVNKYHNLKFTAGRIEVWVPERGDNMYCYIQGSSLTYEKLELFISEIKRYWRLKSSEWRAGDVKRKLEKGKKVSRKDYLPEREIKLLKLIEKFMYTQSFWVDYDFEQLDDFIDELKEHSLDNIKSPNLKKNINHLESDRIFLKKIVKSKYTQSFWVDSDFRKFNNFTNKLNKKLLNMKKLSELKRIITKLDNDDDVMDVDEIIDVLEEARQRNLDFYEPDLNGPKTRYEDFFDVDRDKQIEQRTREEFIAGRNYRGYKPWWIEEEIKKPFPGLKEMLEEKKRKGEIEEIELIANHH